MAKVGDVDSKSLVSKFLQRQIITASTNEEADTSDEIQALLETVATTFLLYPQSALAIVLRAKNTLAQVITAEVELIDFIVSTLKDIGNPNTPIEDYSDIIEAQTALVELDRLGRVDTELQAYNRYTGAIHRFLNKQLATSLKRHQRNEFERSGLEALQDLFQSFASFQPTHQVTLTRLSSLIASVTDFQSVNLTRIVSQKTVSRVRSSLQQVQRGIIKNTVSKTVVALELLAGAASLQSISGTVGVYDPTIQTPTTSDPTQIPSRRTITVSAEQVGAKIKSSAGPWVLGGSPGTPWQVHFKVDGGSTQTIEVPAPNASNRAYLRSAAPTVYSPTLVVPVNQNLFLTTDLASPNDYISIPITSGTRTIAQIVTDITAGLGALGTAYEYPASSGRFLIVGSASVGRLFVLGIGRIIVGGTIPAPTFTVANPSLHALLGFSDGQASNIIGTFTLPEMVERLSETLTGATVERVDATTGLPSEAGTAFGIRSNTLGFFSKLETVTPDTFHTLFGLPLSTDVAATAQPGYLALTEEVGGVTTELSPSGLGVYVGSRVTASDGQRSLSGIITTIDDNHLFFEEELPRDLLMSTVVTAPVVVLIQEMLTKLTPYPALLSGSSLALQQVLSPLLSNPTKAQLANATTVLTGIRSKLQAILVLLDAATLEDERVQYAYIARQILSGLEDRGLDRAADLLRQGLFSTFFSLTKEDASRSSRLMKAMEVVGQNDFQARTVESDRPESVTLQGSNPDQDPLPRVGTSE